MVHGKDGFIDTLTSNEYRAFLLTVDTILALILAAYVYKEPDLLYTREPYERFSHHHMRIDETVVVEPMIESDEEHGIITLAFSNGSTAESIKLRIEPSRLLYAIDRAAYIEILKNSTTVITAAEDADLGTTTTEEEQDYKTAEVPAIGLVSKVVEAYSGSLAFLRSDLLGLFGDEKWKLPIDRLNLIKLVDTLLFAAEMNIGLDWAQRDVLRARLKVALKRVLVIFKYENQKAEDLARHLVIWFADRIPPTTEA